MSIISNGIVPQIGRTPTLSTWSYVARVTFTALVLVCGAAIIWVQGVSRVWYVTVSSLHPLLITAVLPFFFLVGKRPSEGTRPQAVEMHNLMPALPRRQLHPVVHVVYLCQDEVGASPFGVKLGAKTTFDSGRRQQDPIPNAKRAACYPPVVEVFLTSLGRLQVGSGQVVSCF